jgi:hypothetical protein
VWVKVHRGFKSHRYRQSKGPTGASSERGALRRSRPIDADELVDGALQARVDGSVVVRRQESDKMGYAIRTSQG